MKAPIEAAYGMFRVCYEPNTVHVTRYFKSQLQSSTVADLLQVDFPVQIFNSSQRRRDLAALNPGIVEFGWPENLAPPLERICSICKDIDNWLTADKRHLAVLHENGGACRSAVIVACFMHYQQICAK